MKHYNKKKNILCRVLAATVAVSMVMGVSGVSVSAKEFEDVNNEYKYSEAIDVLSSLGIFNGMEDGNFYPENNLTRAEFATIVIRVMQLEDIANTIKNENCFSDMKGHWAQDYVNLALQYGYVSGMDENHFCPDEKITFEQAVKVMVCITGFQSYAESQGGYPEGYIRSAKENKITKSVVLPTGTAMTRGQIAQLILDTMNSEVLKGSGSTKYGWETLEIEGSLMEEFSEYADEKGIVSSVGSTSIDQEAGTENSDYVVIRTDDGELKLKSGATNAQELLGREVRFYTDASKDEDYTLLHIKPTSNNEIISIDGEDLSETTPYESYTYYLNGKSKKLNLDSNVSYIYNGEYYEELTEEEMLPKDGSVMLLDNDSDGKYDIVFIHAFKHLIVSEYLVSDGIPKLYFRPNNNVAMGQLEIEPNGTNGIITIYRDGQVIVPDEKTVIDEWTVASIAQSKSEDTTFIYLSDENVSGTVDSISDDEYGRIYRVDGTEYRAAGTFDENILLGQSHNFLISFNGKIAGINTEARIVNDNYALLMRTSYDSAEEIGYIKLLHIDGTVVSHKVKDELIIDGKKIKGLSASALKTIDDYSLIQFTESDEGYIRKIDTADKSDVCMTTSGYIGYNKDKEFALNVSTNLYFNNVNPPTLGGDMKLDKNTVVFDISSEDEEEWGTGDYKMFNDDTVYEVDAYDLNEYKVAKVVVNHGPTVEKDEIVTWSQSPILIEKVLSTVNEDEEATHSIIGMQDGKRITLMAKNENIADEEGDNKLADMTPGSVIQVRCNLLGEITKIRKLYKAPTQNNVYDTMESRDWKGSDYNVSLHTVYGMCMNVNEEIITVATRMNGQCRAYSISNANIYLYRARGKTADIGTLHDIKPGASYGYDDCSRVFIRMEKDMVKDIVIYAD